MEALLSVAFENLSSKDGFKIKKGLKLVEGLLAPICLSRASHDPDGGQSLKTFVDLAEDPAYVEFFKLQEGFEWNLAQRLLDTLDWLLVKGGDGKHDLLIKSTLELVQGVLLLHPPSKVLFIRDKYMNLLLDLLEPVNCPATQSATVVTLVVALNGAPQNTRKFEDLDGLLTITVAFRSKSTPRDVKLKLCEFLYFYLMPESPSIPRADARDSVPAMLQRSPSKLARAFGGGPGGLASRKRPESSAGPSTLTTLEKQRKLGVHLDHVDELVRDLARHTPFGGVIC